MGELDLTDARRWPATLVAAVVEELRSKGVAPVLRWPPPETVRTETPADAARRLALRRDALSGRGR